MLVYEILLKNKKLDSDGFRYIKKCKFLYILKIMKLKHIINKDKLENKNKKITPHTMCSILINYSIT